MSYVLRYALLRSRYCKAAIATELRLGGVHRQNFGTSVRPYCSNHCSNR